MVFFNDVLPNSILITYFKEIKQIIYGSTERWSASNFLWEDKLREHVSGTCLSTSVSQDLKTKILGHLGSILPPYNPERISLQHCVWLKNSGINWHNDGSHLFGATLYLNKNWNANYGGLFVWRDHQEPKEGHLRAYNPVFNTMVVNDRHEWHLVTAVSPSAPENRFTLQIWGLREEGFKK